MIVYRPIHIYNFGLLVEVVVMMNWKNCQESTATLPITAIKLEAILLDLLSAIQ